jgi:hypothetical protein
MERMNLLRHLSLDGILILNWLLKSKEPEVVEWLLLTPKRGQAGFCGKGSEISGPVKEGELLMGGAKLRFLRQIVGLVARHLTGETEKNRDEPLTG